jgi:3-isopropylmalate dehydrogenase
MRRRKTYAVACLSGDGIGPELMAQACSALAEVSRLHGFRVEDVHAPIGSEAVARFGQPLPPSTRAAYLGTDALLVATAGEAVLAEVERELDLRAAFTRIRLGDGTDVRVVHPLRADLSEWTVERAFQIGRRSKGRLASIDEDGGFAELVEDAADRHAGVAVEHFSVATGLPALAFAPEQFDVVLTGPLFGETATEILASVQREPRVLARGRLAGNGPSVFSSGDSKMHDIAGLGVADPSSMLLTVATLLGEGLGELAAAETLAAAVTDVCSAGGRTLDRLLHGFAASSRRFTQAVLSELVTTHSNAEFLREARA